MSDSLSRKPLRLWPGVAAAVVLVMGGLLTTVIPDGTLFGMATSVLGLLMSVVAAVIVVLWWVLFSRAAWLERLGGVLAMVVAAVVTRPLMHDSIIGAGMGRLFFIFAFLTMCIALVVWAVTTRLSSNGLRRASMVVMILLGSGVWALTRTGGVSGDAKPDLHFRWTLTPEERLLAQSRDEIPAPAATASTPAPPPAAAPAPAIPLDSAPAKPASPPAATPDAAKAVETKPAVDPATAATGDPIVPRREPTWAGFRGPKRDSVIHGTAIETDWARSAPAEIWRRPIGPGWSSFSVDGDVVYTQEQRGEEEIVSAYNLKTGAPIWGHRDRVRFYESNGGPGPRATPTLANGRVYAMGATGLLNALDAHTGKRIWSTKTPSDTDVTPPDWGIASSPLAIDDIVVVAVSGRLVAYDAATGTRRWLGPTGGSGYSSPHLVTIDGVPQILLLRGSRTISVSPTDGTLLWEHRGDLGVGIVQPVLVGERDILVSSGDAMGGLGIRRLTVKQTPSGWTVEEQWASRGLKPYFNDYVVHEGHAYGFDGSILSCIDLTNGERKWKGGRYGNGQLMLLADQDLLLLLSEDGQLALVSATPDKHTEVAKIDAIEGKTWNHPAMVGDVLLVRNGQEMAAFRLSSAKGDQP